MSLTGSIRQTPCKKFIASTPLIVARILHLLSLSGSSPGQRPVNARIHGNFAEIRSDGEWLAAATLSYHS